MIKTMIDHTIRRMNADDVPQVAAIEKALFSMPWSEEAFFEELANPQAVIVVAVVDGEIAGFADMREVCGECYINNVGVLQRYRRKGLGKALMLSLEENVSDAAEFISLEVRQSNKAAIAMYKQLGYIKVGVRKGFYEQPSEDADLMTKIIRNS